ncbi:MAG: HEAT repeat domain-containing protein [Cyanobacteriota bacterium]|nr:HEAT repeat domain-containing protein [Cyanobacteriota bacterium]
MPVLQLTMNEESLTIESAIANLKNADKGRKYYAAWWLGRFRVKEPAAVDALIDALADSSDRTEDGGYPLRRNAARALGKLEDKKAVPHLIECLDCSDYYVREAAAQALEMLGDKSCIPTLTKMLDGGIEAATMVPGKPHLVEPYNAVLEALGTLQAASAMAKIEPFIQHPVPRVEYAAARAMYQLTGEAIYGERLTRALNAEDLQLRRAALMDLGAIGYLKAAKPIAETLAENSMKLIALKGILEHNLQEGKSGSVSDEAIAVMNLMDSLL